VRAALALLGLLLAACSGGPVAGRSVAIDGGTFSYRAEPSRDFGGTDKVDWNVHTAQVYVRYAGTKLENGTVQLTLLDASGVVVLHQTLAPGDAPIPAPSSQGKVGPWTVRLDYDNATGVVGFTAFESQ
jgi:hypothetical protein